MRASLRALRFPGQAHGQCRGNIRIMPDLGLLSMASSAPITRTPSPSSRSKVVHHRHRLLGGVALQHRPAGLFRIDDGVVEKPQAGVVVQRLHVLGGGVSGGLAGLPHEVHEVRLQRP